MDDSDQDDFFLHVPEQHRTFTDSKGRTNFLVFLFSTLPFIFPKHHILIYKHTPKHEFSLSIHGVFAQRVITVAHENVKIIVFSHGYLRSSKSACTKEDHLKYTGEKFEGTGRTGKLWSLIGEAIPLEVIFRKKYRDVTYTQEEQQKINKDLRMIRFALYKEIQNEE